jgi:hypothetical protein
MKNWSDPRKLDRPKFATNIVTKPMLSKARRAYRKTGEPNSTPEMQRELCEKLLAAAVDPLTRTSARLAKYLRGEIKDIRNL